MNIVNDIKKLIKEKKLVIGADETLKGLKTGKFAKIYMASNCPAQLKEDVAHYSSISGVEVIETGLPNTDLGDVCKKPFAISIMGLLK